MAKAYTANFKEKTGSTSGEEPVYLLEITHPQLSVPVRVVRDTLDLTRGHYLSLPGTAGNYASTPDSAAISITGDIDLRSYHRALTAPTVDAALIAKWDTPNNQRSFTMMIRPDGKLRLLTSPDGFTAYIHESTVAASFGAEMSYRATMDVNDGAGNRVVRFYTSTDDGANWSQLGATVTRVGATTIFDSAAELTIGAVPQAPEFEVPFNDLGGGAVDLSFIGNGSATFTRSTPAPAVNSSGQLVSAASGVARSYYDPTTLEYRGYLAEGARTNLCLQSEAFGATWTASNGAVASNSIASPDGATTADKYTANAGTFVVSIAQAIAVYAGATYSKTCYIKAGTYGFIWMGDRGDAAIHSATFNLTTGVVVGSSNLVSSSIKLTSGFYRCEICYTRTNAGAASHSIAFGDSAHTLDWPSKTWAGTENIYLWGAQLEAGRFASTYIPTTTAAVTRNADVLTYPSSGNISGTVGSVVMDASYLDASTNNYFFTANSATDSPVLYGNGSILSWDGTSAVTGGSFPRDGVMRKFGVSFGGSTRVVAISGASVSGAFDGDIGLGANFSLGSRFGSNSILGTIRNARIYQTQFTAAQLQAITAGNPMPAGDYAGQSFLMAAQVRRAEVRSGIDGPIIASFNPRTDARPGDTSFTSSTTGEEWTINQSGATPAAIAATETFTAMDFDIQLPDDIQGRLPRAPIRIDNVGRELTQWIDESKGGRGAQVRVMQVMRDDPDTLEYDVTMDLLGVRQNGAFVTGELGFQDTLNLPALAASYRPDNTPGIF